MSGNQSLEQAGDIYSRYCDYISGMIQQPVEAWSFKSAPDYTYMLEHVTPALGVLYEKSILTEFPDFISAHRDSLFRLIDMNDKWGSPQRAKFEFFQESSPTNLRYIYHALLAVTQMKKVGLREIQVVEVGGGYGGLCYFLSHIAMLSGMTLKKYSIVDLPFPSRLQEKYLSKLPIPQPVSFIPATLFESQLSGEYFFVSAYCIGEISAENRASYVQKLLPYCPHGFVVWNGEKEENLGKSIQVEDERPDYWPGNKFYYF